MPFIFVVKCHDREFFHDFGLLADPFSLELNTLAYLMAINLFWKHILPEVKSFLMISVDLLYLSQRFITAVSLMPQLVKILPALVSQLKISIS